MWILLVSERSVRDNLTRWTPEWLQSLHNYKALLAVLSMGSFVQGFVINGFLPSSITTVEKRFYLSSVRTGARFRLFT